MKTTFETNVVEPYFKRYFYSIGKEEFYKMTVAIGNMVLEMEECE